MAVARCELARLPPDEILQCTSNDSDPGNRFDFSENHPFTRNTSKAQDKLRLAFYSRWN
jgi:hypothetical protein